MTRENVEFFTRFLRDNNFCIGEEPCKLHPAFILILDKYDKKGYGLVHTIVFAIKEYAPTLSYIEQAAICSELTENILQLGGKLAKELKADFKKYGMTVESSSSEEVFDEMCEEMKREQSLT